MLFSSVSFLYGFLPVILLCYFAIPSKWRYALALRNAVLLVGSLFFYAFGEPIYVSLLVISSVSDYFHSLYIEKHRDDNKKAKRALISSIIINLAMLGFFKYTDFFIKTINAILGTDIPVTGIPLPIGISFFTFQTMSYTIDVYRGRVRAQRNLATFATFVCLFPQLIAGPIVRYSDIDAELSERSSGTNNAADGILRFAVGLGKKVIIANMMGQFCEIFRASGDKSVVFFWLYAIAFTMQIYFDFSGYSDMAIGLGKMFGFTFPENFDHPYISRSITEFWRRWHMTLGGWFRDYVYIPLGGNRVGKAKWLRNIAVVWLLTGAWHGAEWNFVLWGLLYGVLLCLEKLFLGKILDKVWRPVQHLYTMFFVVVGFVIFNANGLAGTVADIGGLFGAGGIEFVNAETMYYLRSYAFTFVAAIIGATPVVARLGGKLGSTKANAVLQPLFIAAMLIICTASIVDGSFNPFLYFRF
ncbi:MAG: MBOAT family protein [Oscillospiraceae bacterium]|nr:MBOAT family protein [Oscillospiraceae bacterium]